MGLYGYLLLGAAFVAMTLRGWVNDYMRSSPVDYSVNLNSGDWSALAQAAVNSPIVWFIVGLLIIYFFFGRGGGGTSFIVLRRGGKE